MASPKERERELCSITAGDIIEKAVATKNSDDVLPTQRIDLRQATILFSDIVGITAYFDKYGDLVGKKRLDIHNKLLFSVIEKFSGRIIKTIGDAILAYFETANQAVQAAVAMQKRLSDYNREREPEDQIHIRIGINTGKLVVDGQDVFGDVVNVASRVCAKAGAGQILVTAAVTETTAPNTAKFVRHSTEKLKGKEEETELFLVEWTITPWSKNREESRLCPKCHCAIDADARFCPSCSGIIEDSADPLIGKELDGKFLIEKLIGEGGMGRVYQAVQLSLKRTVCVKVLRADQTKDPTLAERFRREAYAASRLNHPNIVAVQDFGQSRDDGSLYLVMEYIPGRHLGQVIKEEWPLDEKRIVRIMAQVLSALYAAHAAGIVHRDLKPENIMLTKIEDDRDFVKVLDFGLAKLREREKGGPTLTQAGIVCGTPEYMSPEQARGEELDARSDIYSAGVILYHMVTGRVPFTATTPMGVLTRHLVDQPQPPGQIEGVRVSPSLERIILRAMAKKPEDRYPSALAMKEELERSANEKAPSAISRVSLISKWFDETPSFKKRRLWPVIVGVAGLTTIVAGLIFLLSKKKEPAPMETSPVVETSSLDSPTYSEPVVTEKPQEEISPSSSPEMEKREEFTPPSQSVTTSSESKPLVKNLQASKPKPVLPTSITQSQVEKKLLQFNRQFEKLTPARRARLENLLEMILLAMDKKDFVLADRLLDQGLKMIRRGR